MTEQKNTSGLNSELFLVTYLIGNTTASGEHILGGVNLEVSLLVDTSDQSVTGCGFVSQAISPPLNMRSQLLGEYHYQCTMKSCHIMVNVDGVTPYPGIPPTGFRAQPNLKLNMLLEDDWRSGVADYSYCIDGEWQTVKQAHVELIKSSVINDVAALAEVSKGAAVYLAANSKLWRV